MYYLNFREEVQPLMSPSLGALPTDAGFTTEKLLYNKILHCYFILFYIYFVYVTCDQTSNNLYISHVYYEDRNGIKIILFFYNITFVYPVFCIIPYYYKFTLGINECLIGSLNLQKL